jgi:UDP-N-acetylmuramate--alanine ligase
VTNVEADHLDIYSDLADIRRTFEEFVGRGRWVVLCADDAGANTLQVKSSAEVIRYAMGPGEPGATDGWTDARLLARDVSFGDGGARFTTVYDGDALGEVRLQVPGVHNVRNALAALASGLALGATVPRMAEGLAKFGGVERRFQRLGDARGVTVVDDYAHHPTEIEATVSAARAAYPGRRLVVAFQPHLFSRTRDFASEFGRALAAADQVYLCEIYPAREKPIPGVSAALVADAMASAGAAPAWRGERAQLADALAAAVKPGDVVFTVGAGDITKTGPELLARLRA